MAEPADTLGPLSPVLWWKLDDAGPTTADNAGSGGGTFDGTASADGFGAAAFLPDAADTFDTTAARVAVASSPVVGTDWSIHLYYKPTDPTPAGDQTLFMVGADSSGATELLHVYLDTSGFVHFVWVDGDGNFVTSGSYEPLGGVIADGNPHTVTFTSSATQYGLWFDGIPSPCFLPNDYFPPAGVAMTGLKLTVGAMEDGSQPFGGLVAHVAVFDSTVSIADTEALYVAGGLTHPSIGVPTVAPVISSHTPDSFWPMDEAWGATEWANAGTDTDPMEFVGTQCDDYSLGDWDQIFPIGQADAFTYFGGAAGGGHVVAASPVSGDTFTVMFALQTFGDDAMLFAHVGTSDDYLFIRSDARVLSIVSADDTATTDIDSGPLGTFDTSPHMFVLIVEPGGWTLYADGSTDPVASGARGAGSLTYSTGGELYVANNPSADFGVYGYFGLVAVWRSAVPEVDVLDVLAATGLPEFSFGSPPAPEPTQTLLNEGPPETLLAGNGADNIGTAAPQYSISAFDAGAVPDSPTFFVTGTQTIVATDGADSGADIAGDVIDGFNGPIHGNDWRLVLFFQHAPGTAAVLFEQGGGDGQTHVIVELTIDGELHIAGTTDDGTPDFDYTFEGFDVTGAPHMVTWTRYFDGDVTYFASGWLDDGVAASSGDTIAAGATFYSNNSNAVLGRALAGGSDLLGGWADFAVYTSPNPSPALNAWAASGLTALAPSEDTIPGSIDGYEPPDGPESVLNAGDQEVDPATIDGATAPDGPESVEDATTHPDTIDGYELPEGPESVEHSGSVITAEPTATLVDLAPRFLLPGDDGVNAGSGGPTYNVDSAGAGTAYAQPAFITGPADPDQLSIEFDAGAGSTRLLVSPSPVESINFVVGVFFQTTETDDMVLVEHVNGDELVRISVNAGLLRFELTGDDDSLDMDYEHPDLDVSDGTPHEAAIVFYGDAGADIMLVVDGVQIVYTDRLGTGDYSAGGSFAIGASVADTRPFTGFICDAWVQAPGWWDGGQLDSIWEAAEIAAPPTEVEPMTIDGAETPDGPDLIESYDPLPAAILALHPLLWWRLNDVGPTVHDWGFGHFSGTQDNDYEATATDVTFSVPGLPDAGDSATAAQFDGVGSIVTSDSPLFPLSGSGRQFSVIAFFQTSSSARQHIVYSFDSPYHLVQITIDGGQLTAIVNGYPTSPGSEDVIFVDVGSGYDDGQPHMVGLMVGPDDTIALNQAQLWVDGVKIAQAGRLNYANLDAGIPSAGDTTRAGEEAPFDGTLQHIAFSDVVNYPGLAPWDGSTFTSLYVLAFPSSGFEPMTLDGYTPPEGPAGAGITTTFEIRTLDGASTPVGPIAITVDEGPLPEYYPLATVALYDRTGATLVADLANAFDVSWQDVVNDRGVGRFSLALSDAQAALVAVGQLVQCSIYGLPGVYCWRIETCPRETLTQDEEAGQVVQASGRGRVVVLEDAKVHPYGGVDRQPPADTRSFSFASPDYYDGGWVGTSVDLGAFGDLSLPWVGVIDGELVPAPFGWVPDLTPASRWIWGAAPNTPAGSNYFRKFFNLATETKLSIIASADNYWTLFLDGVAILGDNAKLDAWQEHRRCDVTLSAGDHLLAAVVNNPIVSPAGFLCSVFIDVPAGADPDDVPTVLLITDGSWESIAYPATEPGFTPGSVVNRVISDAQARGQLLDVTYTFTDFADSNGNSWPTMPEFTVNVGDSVLDVMDALVAGGWLDWWMAPGANQLSLWRFEERGTTSPTTFAAGVNLADLNHGQATPIANRLLVKYGGGLFVVNDAGSQAAHGVIESYLTLDVADRTEAERLANRALLEVATQQPAISASIEPHRDAAGAFDSTDRPYVDVQPADRVVAPAEDGTPTSYRLLSVTVTVDDMGDPELAVELNRRTVSVEETRTELLRTLGSGVVGDGKGSKAVSKYLGFGGGPYEPARFPSTENTPVTGGPSSTSADTVDEIVYTYPGLITDLEVAPPWLAPYALKIFEVVMVASVAGASDISIDANGDTFDLNGGDTQTITPTAIVLAKNGALTVELTDAGDTDVENLTVIFRYSPSV